MDDFDAQWVRDAIDAARNPIDPGEQRARLEAVLGDDTLSDHDRGRVLVALAVVAQGTAAPEKLIEWLDEAVVLLRRAAAHRALGAALGMAAAVHASTGNIRACLDHCLALLGIESETKDPIGGRVALNFGVALLTLGAYPMACVQLERAVIDNLDEPDLAYRTTMTVVACLNLVLVVYGAELVGSVPVTHADQQRRLALIRDALDRIRTPDLAPETEAFVCAILALAWQIESDLTASTQAWGSLDALDDAWPDVFGRYLAMIEAPIALHRGDLDRADALIERCLGGDESRAMVPYRRIVGLRLRADLHERRGDAASAIEDLRASVDEALRHGSELPDALIQEMVDRTELEQIRRGLVDNTTRLAELVVVDELTRVGNRRGFELCLDELRPQPVDAVVLMLDLDNFKPINDRHGHAIGDRVIERSAEIITAACRTTDQIFRYGGDEFVVVPSLATTDVGYAMADRIADGFNGHDWSALGVAGDVTVSIGLASGPANEIDDVVAAADMHLYAAKHAGRNTVRPTRDAVEVVLGSAASSEG